MSLNYPKPDHVSHCPLFWEALAPLGGGVWWGKIGHRRWVFGGYGQPWVQHIPYFLGHCDMSSRYLVFLLPQPAVLLLLPDCWCNTLKLWVTISPPVVASTRYVCHTDIKEMNAATNPRANEKRLCSSSEHTEKWVLKIHSYVFYSTFPLLRIHLNICLLVFIETIWHRQARFFWYYLTKRNLKGSSWYTTTIWPEGLKQDD